LKTTLNKKSTGDILFAFFNTILMIFLMFICLYPFLYVVFASLSESNKIIQHSGMLWKPLGFSTAAYSEVLKNRMLIVTYKNTLFYLVLGTAISMVLTIFGAFVLSRKDVMIKKALNIMVVITMFFSGGLIPLYLTVKEYNMLDTIWSVLLPGALSAWNLIVMRTSFSSIPDSLEESAFIDGASEITILTKIILPLSKSILAVMVLFYGVTIWNSWFNASIFLKNRELYPLQLYLREVLLNSNTDSMMAGGAQMGLDRLSISETIKYSTIVITTLPILFVYPFLQKYFVKGVMVGALKG